LPPLKVEGVPLPDIPIPHPFSLRLQKFLGAKLGATVDVDILKGVRMKTLTLTLHNAIQYSKRPPVARLF